jgi:hypothetical protein
MYKNDPLDEKSPAFSGVNKIAQSGSASTPVRKFLPEFFSRASLGKSEAYGSLFSDPTAKRR